MRFSLSMPPAQQLFRQLTELFRIELPRNGKHRVVRTIMLLSECQQDEDDLYPLSVMNNLFGGGMSSRLFQRIREEMGAVYSVYSFPSTYTNCGTFTVYAGTSPESAQKVADELHHQIRLLCEDGVTQEEFEMAKEQLKVSYVLGLESSSSRMSAIGRSKLLRGKAVDPQDVIRKIEAVTKEDVERVTREMFSKDCAASAVGRNIEQLKLL